MHFQIYIPGAKGLTTELATVGLGDFVTSAETIAEPIGPDGNGGAVFAWWNPRCRQIGYRPDDQTWKKAEGYWFGLWNDAPPTPQELARPYQEPGKRIRLGDGSEWLVPQPEKLDRNLVLADDGTWRFELQRQHHQLWLDALSWAQKFQMTDTGDKRVEVNFGELADFVVGVLRLNYRLTREVVSEMRLLSVSSMQQAFAAIVGVDVTLGFAE